MERLQDFFTLRAGAHKGKKIAVLNLLPEEIDLSAKELKERYLNAGLVYKSEFYKVIGVENVRFFVPNTHPAIGVLLEEIKEKIDKDDKTRDNKK